MYVTTALTLQGRCRKLLRGEVGFEETILEMNFSSGFTALLLLPLVHVTEIWRRIEYVNSWGTFQVNANIGFEVHITAIAAANTSSEHVAKRKYTRTEVNRKSIRSAVFWDIKTQFVLHRRHITSPLLSPTS
jgi:hypothetical protein